MLEGKHILLGVTGSIAAYKTATLIRLLVKAGAEVKVVMTPLAKEFITPLTLATLSKNPILVDFFDPTNGAWNSHVSLGSWADMYLIAPASANTIAKMANGVADNLLLTSYLSAKCPVCIAPAMDLDMYAHPATQRNLKQLKADGVSIVEPDDGELASGLIGKGRMAEPEKITETLQLLLDEGLNNDLKGKTVLVTAGPTIERLDPVRYISNFSTGKMGFAIADECAMRGAYVILICGPVPGMQTKHTTQIKRIDVESAEDMYESAMEAFSKADIAILSAAVADYTPENIANQKIKKGPNDGPLVLRLKETKDIAEALGKKKRDGQRLVGFALETHDETTHAIEKMKRKNFDFIVLNSLNDDQAGFGYDTNKVTILFPNGKKKEYDLKSKCEVAKDILDELTSLD